MAPRGGGGGGGGRRGGGGPGGADRRGDARRRRRAADATRGRAGGARARGRARTRRVALADRRNDVLAVRLSNSGTERMFINWKEAHLRWPNGYESPVEIIPGNALTSIYPGGTVEYHLKPAHTYVPRDRLMYRRHSLTNSLFPLELFEAHEADYKLRLFLPVCKGEATEDGTAEKKNCVVWKVQTTVARH